MAELRGPSAVRAARRLRRWWLPRSAFTRRATSAKAKSLLVKIITQDCTGWALAARTPGLPLRQTLLQVADDVFRVLKTDRQAHHVGAGPGNDLLVVGELAVRGRSRMDDQGTGVAD